MGKGDKEEEKHIKISKYNERQMFSKIRIVKIIQLKNNQNEYKMNIVEKKLCNLTQAIVSRRLHSTSLASEGSCLTRAVSIARSFVSVTTKSWTLFKTVWRVSVLVNKELFIFNIHRKIACNGGKRVTNETTFITKAGPLQGFCYHVTILQVYLAFRFYTFV